VDDSGHVEDGEDHYLVLGQLRDSGAVRADIDAHTIATMYFGPYFAASYRGEDSNQLPEQVVAVR
jgi:hypothetical protein